MRPKEAAALNGVDKVVSFEKSRGLRRAGEAWRHDGRKFDVVICDPPAFVKNRKDLKIGAQGYRKMVRLGGASRQRAAASSSWPRARIWSIRRCSPSRFAAACAMPSRTGRILRTSGAALDHPVHPNLPETGLSQGADACSWIDVSPLMRD